MGRHKGISKKAYRRQQKVKKALKKKGEIKSDIAASEYTSSSFPDIIDLATEYAETNKEESVTTLVVAKEQLKTVYNDPLYVKMKEYVLLQSRLAEIVNQAY